MDIEIDTNGLILKGEYEGWNVFIETQESGAYLVLITSPGKREGYDDLVENFQDLKKYFKEAKWKIQWLSKN